MQTLPSRFVFLVLISAATELICTMGVWAQVVPSTPGLTVYRQPIAQPVIQGMPVVKPITNEASASTNPTASSAAPKANLSPASAQSVGCTASSSQPAPLVALVSALKCDPDLIFEYVYNNIEFEPLYGSNKGPLGTLLDRRGNDADQAILFVTLLNIAGYSQTGYLNVLLGISGGEIANWLGVKNDAVAIENLLSLGGIPFAFATANPDGTLASIAVLHFQAALQLNGTWYSFDPSFKQHTILPGISNLASALGYNRSQFLSDAGGTIDSVSISNVNRASLRSDLVGYANNLVNYINQNNPTWSVGNVIGGKSIQPLQGSPIRETAPSTPSSIFPATCPNQTPTPECRTYLIITMPGASSSQSIKLYTDQIYGHRITVFSTPSGSNFIPTLLVDGAAPSCVAAGTCTNVGPATAVGTTWSISTQVAQPNQPSSPACPSGVTATACKTLTVAAGSSYLIGVGTGRVGRGMADYHRQLIAQARAAGSSDSSELVLGESLATISYSWLAQLSATQNLFDHLTQVTMIYNFATGITGQANIQQSGFQGPYVDLPVNLVNVAVQNSAGPNTVVGGILYPTAFVSAGLAEAQTSSSFESAVLEQTQAPVAGMTAASTIKIIDSNMNPSYSGSLGRTFFADGTTPAGQTAYTSTIQPAISPHYSSSDLSAISSAVSSGYQVVIPENGRLAVGAWSGAGYTQTLAQTGELTITQKISGGMSGGFTGADDPNPPENTEITLPPVASSDTSNPIINTIPAPTNPPVFEPVDGITGAYVYKNTDLTTGGSRFPYALNFSRTYLSSSGSFLTSTNSDAGMGNGWAHNWSSNIQIQSDPYLGIGVDNSPAVSAVTSIVALYVMQDLMSVTPTAQTETVSSMVARWLTDQLTGNVVVVSQPNTTEEFIALPHADGSTNIAYNPPPTSATRLSQTASGQFSYRRKDGVTSNFGPTPTGALQSVVYPNGVAISLMYSGSPLSLSKVANNQGRSLTLAYNGTHVSSVTDDSGRSVNYAYDGNNNLVGFTDPVGFTTTYAYDTSGNYDTFGHLTQVFYPSNPASPFVTNWYDPLGRVVKQANATGAITSLYFAGSRTETVDPLSDRHVTYQTDRGRVLSDAYVLSSSFGDVFNDTVQQNGVVNITHTQYDGLDRPLLVTLPEDGTAGYTYDTNNNVLTQTLTPKPGSPLAPQVTTYTYDPIFNKPTSVTDPLGLVLSNTYDGNGNLLISISDVGSPPHLNARNIFTYNSVGKVLTATDPLGVVTQNAYDSFGNQTSIIRDAGPNHLNQLTTLAYSPVGDITSVTDPRGNVTTRTYDGARRPASTTSPPTSAAPNGLVTNYSYDPNGQLILTQQSANGALLRSTSTTYTLTGKPATTTDANNNTTRFSYDAVDRLASVSDAMQRVTLYGYDAMSRQISISNPAIQTTPLLQQSYTPDGLLASLTDANSHATGFAYDGLDRLATTTYPDSSTEKLTYDADSNILTRQTRAGQTITYTFDTLNRLSTKTPPSPAAVVSYGYDLAGHTVSVTDTSAAITAPVSGAVAVMNYSYDTLNRLTATSFSPVQAQAPPTVSTAAFTFAYNAANQRIGQSATDNSFWAYPAATRSTVSYTANNLNQYTAVGPVSPTYDGNGNLTFDGNFIYCYDAENRLIAAISGGTCASPTTTVATYAYDGQGRRKSKTVSGATTITVTDPANRALLDYDGTSGAILRWYAFGLGLNDVLSQTNVAAGTRTTFIPDTQGSIVATLDSGSGVLTKVGYLPFGASPGSPITFGFTGQAIDPETNGLYYFRARHYSPLLGRFMQVDPIGFSGGINLYAYVGNDPLNKTDPFGDYVQVTQNGNNVTLNLPAIFQGPNGAPADPAAVAAYTQAIQSAWTNQYPNYNVILNVTTPAAGTPSSQYNVVQISPLAGNACGGAPCTVGGNFINVAPLGTANDAYNLWSAGHEAGHAMGLTDMYYNPNFPGQPGQLGQPIAGYENNIMGAAFGTPEAQDISNILYLNSIQQNNTPGPGPAPPNSGK